MVAALVTACLATLAALGAVPASAARFALITECDISRSEYSCAAVRGLRTLIAKYPRDQFYVVTKAADSDCRRWMDVNASAMDVIVSLGFQYGDCMVVAPRFPKTWFVSLDVCNDQVKPRSNYICGLFMGSFVSYAAGYVAGLASSTKVLGVLGGIPVDGVMHLVNGFSLGVAASCPGCRIIAAFVNSFHHAKHAAAVAHYFVNTSGADVVAGFGGTTGSVGIFHAAQSGSWAIGVDVDELLTTFAPPVPDSVAARLLTTAEKKLDISVVLVADLLLALPAGADVPGISNGIMYFDYANGGVGLAPCRRACLDLVADSAWKQVLTVELALATGRIQVDLQPSGRMLLPGSMQANTFRPPAAVRGLEPEPRMQHAMASFGSAWTDYLAIFGGVGSSGTLLGDLWLFNVGTTLWETADMGFTIGTPPLPHMKSCLVGLGNTLLVFGGRDASASQSSTAFTFTLQPDFLGFGNPTSPEIAQRWANLSIKGAPVALEGAGCLAANSSCALVYGGRGRFSEQRELHRLCLDGLGSATWVTLWPTAGGTAGPPARDLPSVGIVAGASVGLKAETEVLVVAGGTVSGTQIADVWAYLLRADVPTWKQLPSLPVAPPSQLILFTEQAVGAAGDSKPVLVAQLTSVLPGVGLGAFTFDVATNTWSIQEGLMLNRSGTRLDGLTQSVGVRSADRTWLFGGQLSGESRSALVGGPWLAAFDLQRGCLPGERAVGTDCVACPTGKVSLGGVGAACRDCAAGRAANKIGQSACESCPAGRFSGGGAVSCSACPAGRSTQMETGSEACRPCTWGRFSGAAAQTCDLCPIGTYSNIFGSTTCIRCQGGLTTQFPGTESSVLCGCTEGSYRPAADVDRDRCDPCPEGMRCDWGSDWRNLGTGLGPHPVTEPGFMTLPAEPLKVYYCIVEEDCPGGSPGQCAALRDANQVACGACEPGSYRSGNQCRPCDAGAGAAPLAIALVLGLLAALLMLWLVSKDSKSSTHGGTNVIVMAGVTTSTLQILGLYSALSVAWLHPLGEVVRGLKLLNFQLDVLQLSCSLPSGTVAGYVYAQLPPILGALVLIFLIGLKKCWRPGTRVLEDFGNTYGSVINLFFVPILLSTLRPLLCYSHPSGNGASMISLPSVICFHGSTYFALLGIGIASFFVYVLPFAAIMLYTTFQYRLLIVTLVTEGDSVLLNTMRWLFFKYTPERYYYGSVVLLRSFLLCLIPVVLRDHGRLQNFFMTMALVVFLVVQTRLHPWRSTTSNAVDGCVALMLTLLLQGASPESRRGTDSAMEAAVIVCLIIIFFSCAASLALFVFNMIKVYPFYDDFICHHKLDAAGQARYLKMLLESTSTSKRLVFIDSDHLKDLDVLFDDVKVRTGRLVVYLTADTLRRPWCLGEITTACRGNVKVVRVVTPCFVPLTVEQCRDPAIYVDFSGVAFGKYGISMSDIAEALEWFSHGTLPEVLMDDESCGTMRFVFIAIALLANQNSGTAQSTHAKDAVPTVAGACGKVVVSADPHDDEAIAVAGILGLKIGRHVFNTAAGSIANLHDFDFVHGIVGMSGSREDIMKSVYSQVILSSFACVIVLSAKTLACGEQLYAIAQSQDLHPHCIVPLTSPSFRFPNELFYLEKLSRCSLLGSFTDAESRVRSFFYRIAIAFSTNASDQLLTVQAQEVFRRFPTSTVQQMGSITTAPLNQAGPPIAADQNAPQSVSVGVEDSTTNSEDSTTTSLKSV